MISPIRWPWRLWAAPTPNAPAAAAGPTPPEVDPLRLAIERLDKLEALFELSAGEYARERAEASAQHQRLEARIQQLLEERDKQGIRIGELEARAMVMESEIKFIQKERSRAARSAQIAMAQAYYMRVEVRLIRQAAIKAGVDLTEIEAQIAALQADPIQQLEVEEDA